MLGQIQTGPSITYTRVSEWPVYDALDLDGLFSCFAFTPGAGPSL